MSVLDQLNAAGSEAFGDLIQKHLVSEEVGFEVFRRGRGVEYAESTATLHLSLFHDQQSDLRVGDRVSIVDQEVGMCPAGSYHGGLQYVIVAFVSVLGRVSKTGVRFDLLTCILRRDFNSVDRDRIYTKESGHLPPRSRPDKKIYLFWTGILQRVPEEPVTT